jgi:CheY-like chemotaxis protein
MVVANKRVLVVDDETIVCESYKLALMDAGYDVRTVGTGNEAIQACRAERFDVMLADLRMPDMDGMEVAKIVAKEFPELRVVMITGYPSRESAEQAARLGVSDYLQKPLSPERLSEATAAALARPMRMPAPSVAAAPAPKEPVKAEAKEPESQAIGQPRPRAASNKLAREAVLVSVGFLAGVTIAYFLAPVHILAYLMVGTAIASGTILGLLSDAFFVKDAKSEPRHEATTSCCSGPKTSGSA